MDRRVGIFLGILLLLLTMFSEGESSRSVTCPNGYSVSGSICYNYHTDCITWAEASAACERGGGFLYKVADAESFQLIDSKVVEPGLCDSGVWVGSRLETGNVYKWRDGSILSSTSQYWAKDQPDYKGEECVEVRNVFNNLLNDRECGMKKGYICQVCHNIDHCINVACPTPSTTQCDKCEENSIFYNPSSNKTSCERLCSWNNHYCWPGSCTSGLTRGCKCAPGFRKVAELGSGATYSGETSCQPDTFPDILTCDTLAVGPNGEKTRAESSSNSTECKHLQDMYGNYQPVQMEFKMMSEFTVDITSYTSYRPSFISEEKFGISDTSVKVVKRTVQGNSTVVSDHKQFVDSNVNSSNVIQTQHDASNITVLGSKYSLNNGEALCLEFEAKGGGYLKGIDRRSSFHNISGPIPYKKVTKHQTVCYRYDNSAPKHCAESGMCASNSLDLQDRITRSNAAKLTFSGWTDPIPKGGTNITASSIESYEIRVNEVPPGNGTLKVDLKSVLTAKVNSSINMMEIELPFDSPRLYCITLEVKDVANNVMQARRFMLFDNTSFIETNEANHFRFASASPENSFTWQTHHNDICIIWKGYFINKIYLQNELLNPIEPAPHQAIQGVYEQITGVLPVTGTTNVYGIIKYYVSWNDKEGNFTSEQLVQDFQNQTFCTKLNVSDGQTYTFNIRPVDIVGNTYNESRTLYIDRSHPHINNVWLEKDGYERLFVHNSTDLSTMQMSFDAFDPHSALKLIEWKFGIADTSTELLRGYISVRRVANRTCTTNQRDCYCPDIGSCEHFRYKIPLNKLIEVSKNVGNHNRNYVFTITVTNNAMLSTTELIDVLVDSSPPEKGVVFEGPIDYNDIDYTSEDSFVVHWHGFIDHESGIKLYRLGLAKRCLTKEELANISGVIEYNELPFTETSVRMFANFTGKRYVSIIAINNAMESSDSVCSDGITRDISAPSIQNLTLQHAFWSESLICHDGRPYVLLSNLQKKSLYNCSACTHVCNRFPEQDIPGFLQTTVKGNEDDNISDFLCQHLPVYTNETFIYLPDDHIFLQWNVEETGSQIEDFFVGLGTDRTEKDSPSVLNYVSTDRKFYFKQRHEAIGSDEMFYIFIKVFNKAGISSIATLGPILIDQTPPMYRYVPHVNIEGNNVVLAWESDTFYDEEQTEQINQILFQFVKEEMPVSALLEWRLESSDPCPLHSGGCIKYPLSRLQSHETGDGDSFGMNIHIYNNARHFTSVATEPFQVPSRYPPAQGYVFDLDPELLDDISKDINVHFTEHTMCAFWGGFKHHEAIALEVGVGTERVMANIVQFQSVSNSTSFCLNSSSISAGRIQYFLIRANCSGGSTISASNGVLIKPIAYIQNELEIHLGQDCHSTSEFEETTYFSNFTATVVLHNPLYIGKRYSILSENDDWKQVTIDTADGIVAKSGDMNYFTSFFEYPRLHLKHSLIPNTTILVKINICPSENLISTSTQLTINWKTKTRADISGLMFSVAVLEMIDSNENVIVPFQNPIDSRNITLHDLHLEEQKQYIAQIKICNNIRCLLPTKSLSFAVEISEPKISFLESGINISPVETCVSVKVSWKAPVESNISFYQWALSSDGEARKLLLIWENIIPSKSSIEKVQKCVALPVYGHATSFACVRLFSVSGLSSTSCVRTTRLMMGAYTADIVYELDTSKDKMILQKISSADIGHHYTQLHDSELDVGSANSSVAGALVYASERTVNWFLMTSRYVPQKCNADHNCHANYTTSTGYVEIKNEDVTLNQLYYICAFSNNTEVKRESSVEILKELSSCGNGFILDSLPPTQGQIRVHHHDGFISNPKHVSVSWTGFNDNVDATLIGYPGKIQYFSIGIGTQRGGDDLAHEFKPGFENRVILNIQTAKDGTPIFVTVNATDYAGYTAGADSSEFIVDASPPLCGRITLLNNLQQNQYINDKISHFKFESFSDPHSGIDYFNVGMGTFENMTDIISETKTNDDCVEWNLSQLIEGHPYYIIVQAVNRAGLLSKPASLRFVVDRTSPLSGHVLDGIADKDIDFQADIDVLHANWRNFYDTESEIALYRVGLGTEPYQSDQNPLTNVGQMTEFTWKGPFVPGLKYFVTVEACNRADLCSIRSSDGVILDNSPPIRGIVYVGPGSGHNKYLPQRSSVHIKWVGFEDPQSSIDHYEVCVSTTSGVCDVVQRFNALLHSTIIKSNITLPINRPLTATVWATNGVGMKVSQVSDTFIVDDIPPFVKEAPQFGNIKIVRSQQAQWEKSKLELHWEFVDDVSPIVRHEISLKTHHEGHTPVEHVVLGSERTLCISLDGNNWLQSGDTYYAIVTACNAAGLCTSERTNDLLIDSTPPHLGGFKQPLIWTEYINAYGQRYTNLTLTWYGFHDTESRVEKYFITVSRAYSKYELSNGVVAVLASNDTKLDMQSTMDLSEVLLPDESIILSIWAQNLVGLNSSTARVTVNVLSSTNNVVNKSGTLEIQKHSCDIHFCNKDCTCAVLGRPCVEVTTNATCNNISYSDAKTQNLPTFTVNAGLMDENTTMSSSSACISGHWLSTDGGNISEQVHRFEWSIGIFSQAIGEGVFNLNIESPWTDIGMRTEFIYCLPANRSFIHDEQYVIYLKAWYDKDTFLVFQSTPILIDFTPPIVRRGKYIREGSCTQDVDFISWTDHIIACWDGVFSEQQTRIQHYDVSLGSRPHNNDIYPITNVGLETALSLQNISLSPGTRYYVTVIAMNTVGLQNAAVSDGFIVDTDFPIEGVVFNTLHHRNSAFQRTNTSIGISWHGFQDNMSGIKKYFVAFSKAESFNETNVKYTDAQLLTSYVFSNLSLQQGESYVGIVKSEDAAGHQSSLVISNPFTVDMTPPKGYSCHSTERLPIDVKYTSNKLSFNVTLTENHVYYIRGNVTNASNDLYPVLMIDKNRSPIPFAERHDGLNMYNYCFLAPSTSTKFITVEFGTNLTEIQNHTLDLLACKSLQWNDKAAVTVKQIGHFSLAVNLIVVDYESKISKIKIGAGTSKGGFQITPLFEIHNQNNIGIIRSAFKHGNRVYVTAVAENHAGLSGVFHSEQAITIDHTPPNIGDIKVTVNVHGGFSKTFTFLANWNVNDNETAVEYCRCLLGHAPSLTNIQPERESDTITKCQFEELYFPHASTVYVTVKCVNSVELASVAFSGPVTIYHEPPGSAQAFVSFIPMSEQSAPTTETVHNDLIAQSNKSTLQFEWNDFMDDSQILSYQYRVFNDGQVILDWSNVIFKDMAAINNLRLVSGKIYTAEVKATNAGNFSSSSVNSSLIVSSEPPKLTGLQMKISAENRSLHFDWTDVFLPIGSISHHYSLVIGSRNGFPDIADVQFTRDQVYGVIVPETTHVTNDVNELFISVSCVYNTGLFSSYQISFKL